MNHKSQIEYMDFMMNVKEDIMSEFGSLSQNYLIIYPLQQ